MVMKWKHFIPMLAVGLLLLSTTARAAELQKTVGVSVGDSFKFKLETLSGDTGDSDMDLAGGLKEGDVMEVEITSLPNDTSDFGGMKVTYPNGTTEGDSNYYAELGNLVIYTSWDYWAQEATDDGFTVDNGDSAFKMNATVEVFGISMTIEYEYEKDTGVMNMMYINSTFGDSQSIIKIVREGGGMLPGFELYIALFSVAALGLIVKKKR